MIIGGGPWPHWHLVAIGVSPANQERLAPTLPRFLGPS